MIAYAMENGMPILKQPLDDNEVSREIIARRTFVAAMVMGQRIMALAKVQPEYPMPRPLPDQFYGGTQ